MKSEWPTICGSRHLHVAALWLATLAVPPGLLAQDPMSRAFDLERRGSYAQAVEIYFAVLKERPAELTALLGLERSLTPLNRSSELLAPVQAAITASPGSVPLYAIGMRAYAAADLLDSLPRLVDLWAKAAPGDESPYREWASAALSRRDRATARRAYELGRERLGKPDVLAAEMAQLAVLDGDWPAAVREWCRAVRQLPGYRTSAINALSPAPDRARPDILKSLDREPGPEAARIAVDLRARWGDPLGALESLMKVLPASQGQQVDVLQGFLEELRGEGSRPYLMAQGKVLEAIADRWTGSAQRARLRLESARAYAGAGDRVAARRLLGQIANDSGSGAVAAGASATLIELLVQDGKPDDAAAQLEKYHSTLGVDDYLRLRRAIAARWGQSGDLKPYREVPAAVDPSA